MLCDIIVESPVTMLACVLSLGSVSCVEMGVIIWISARNGTNQFLWLSLMEVQKWSGFLPC
jgi:hypothetical protein